MTRRLLALVAAASLLPALASAQTRPAPPPSTPAKPAARPARKPPGPPKNFIAFGVAGLVQPTRFTQSISFPLFLEEATVTGPVRTGRGAGLDISGGRWLTKRLGLFGTFEYARVRGPLQATYSLPSPVVFDSFKTADGSATARRTTTSFDADLLALLASGKHWQLMGFGGPTVIFLQQQIATDVLTYAYTYPFDTITVTPQTSGHQSKRGVGGNAGIRFAWLFGRRLALTFDAAWRGATIRLSGQDSSFKVREGGALTGAGLRIMF